MITREQLAELVRTEWRAGELPAFVPGDDFESRLPDAPRPVWAAPLLFAAPLVRGPEPFLQAIQEANLPLAGECAALIKAWKRDDGVRLRRRGRTGEPAACSPAYLEELRWALVARSRDRDADLRARIAAGRALGELGDPRYTLGVSAEGRAYLLPPLVAIPAGHYRLGSNDHDHDEKEARTEWLDGFQIARFPVTNAEWRCFMEAGGYADKRWWKEGEARRWWELQPDEPEHWKNSAFNALSQPVVVVTLHEARAYCEWLSAASGQRFRLATEQQWEAAARGPEGRTYPWGADFEAHRTNLWETGVRATTPVGAFPDGDTPAADEDHRVGDLAGNVWEWTESPYTREGYHADGSPSGVMGEDWGVVRGGSWLNDLGDARASYRGDGLPGDRYYNLGCRLVCVSPIRR